MSRMNKRTRWRKFESQPWVQTVEFGLGILLLIIAGIIGPLPGPGGIFFAAPGLALILRTSLWARKNYVKFKRWQPKLGGIADTVLRRPSAKRRSAIAKARKAEQEEVARRVTEMSSSDLPGLTPPETTRKSAKGD